MELERKPLNTYTDDELYIFLENNETIDMIELGAICSEILRRLLKYKRGGFNDLEK